MTDKHYFIEKNDDGRVAVRAESSKRATRLVDTQKEAKAIVKDLNPNDKPNLERLNDTKKGKLPQWR